MDDRLLQKSSLAIELLPETKQDRQMAALMKLQTKSAQERESEKRLDILMKPALPGATQTTFGGLKRQKALNAHLNFNDLGIKKPLEAKVETISKANEECFENLKYSAAEIEIETLSNIASENASDISKSIASMLDLPKSLALVCDYASSTSSNDASD